jgi:hypothetical protein
MFDDAVLNDSLCAAGLSALQDETKDGKLTLDSKIAVGGNNLSVGERQIIALGERIVGICDKCSFPFIRTGRAINQGSKVLISDEGQFPCVANHINLPATSVIGEGVRNASLDLVRCAPPCDTSDGSSPAGT